MNIAIVAGEVSGDIQAARLVSEVKKQLPDVTIWGMGGAHMKTAGCELIYDITQWALIGFWEVVKNYGKIRKVFWGLLEEIKRRQPRVVILVDYPGFNLRLARKIKALKIPVIYYISPQIWAWGRGRIKQIRELISKMIVIFPFEKEMYESEGVPVEFVGHPIIDVLEKRKSNSIREMFRKELGVGPRETLIGILPGSREQEVKRHIPALVPVIGLMPRARFVFGAASGQIAKLIPDINVPVLTDRTYDIMEASDLIITSSGTATLETACFGTPMVVIYRINWITYYFIKKMIKIPFIAMVNVVSGKKIVPELIQNNVTSANIAAKALEIVKNPDNIKAQLAGFKEKLGSPGVAGRAAKIVCEAISD